MFRLNQFQIAGGSITGAEHIGRNGLVKGINNHDAFDWTIPAEDVVVAIVTDGCGGSPKRNENSKHGYKHSEFGAKLGARLLIANIAEQFRNFPPCTEVDSAEPQSPTLLLSQSLENVLAQLRVLANAMTESGGSFSQTIRDYFLFTSVGAIITPATTAIFSIGDGVYALNGSTYSLGPFPDNTPPYLAYNLVNTVEFRDKPELLQFSVQQLLPTSEVQSLLIGSDGVEDLITSETRRIPGQDELVGPISQFWSEERYFKNRFNIQRKLALLNSEVSYQESVGNTSRTQTAPRLLPDDTTFVVLKRRE